MKEGLNNNIKPPASKFRFTAEEIKEKIDVLMKSGRTEDEAREIVLTEELLAQTKQEMAKKGQEKDKRYDVGNITDWAA